MILPFVNRTANVTPASMITEQGLRRNLSGAVGKPTGEPIQEAKE
jgi:hypothetical protein